MSSKYKPGEDAIAHFVTFAVVGWIDVFSREDYKEIFINSLQYCQKEKGLTLHAYVIMTNHVHLIISSNTNKIEDIVRDLKKYTSKQIIKPIWRKFVLAHLAQVCLACSGASLFLPPSSASLFWRKCSQHDD